MSKTAKVEKSDYPLPLPPLVLSHHGETLAPTVAQWQAQERVPPVLLMVGLEGVGKRTMAFYLAQWLLCERAGFGGGSAGTQSPDDAEESLFGGLFEEKAPEATAEDAAPHRESGPCGTCTSCRQALAGSWVDFTEILPESSGPGDNDSGKLKIEQFRKLIATMGFGAHQSRFKITLIPNADRMTAQAANSVLKLLEEPPRGWIFLLTASDPSLLLPTLVSRCQRLRLKPFDSATLRELLADSGLTSDRIAQCAELAQGSWGKSLALANAELWERRQLILSFLENPGMELNTLVDWASQGNDNLHLLLDHLEQLCRDLIHSTLAGAGAGAGATSAASGTPYVWKQKDAARALTAVSRQTLHRLGSLERARSFWLDCSERFARARQEASAPLNKKLLVQDLLLPFLV